MFGEHGVTVAPYHNKVDEDTKANALLDFDDHRINGISSVGQLTHGIDFHSVDAVVMARATKSEALWLQSISRGLLNDKESLLLIDWAINDEHIAKLATLIRNISGIEQDKDGVFRRVSDNAAVGGDELVEALGEIQEYTGSFYDISDEVLDLMKGLVDTIKIEHDQKKFNSMSADHARLYFANMSYKYGRMAPVKTINTRTLEYHAPSNQQIVDALSREGSDFKEFKERFKGIYRSHVHNPVENYEDAIAAVVADMFWSNSDKMLLQTRLDNDGEPKDVYIVPFDDFLIVFDPFDDHLYSFKLRDQDDTLVIYPNGMSIGSGRFKSLLNYGEKHRNSDQVDIYCQEKSALLQELLGYRSNLVDIESTADYPWYSALDAFELRTYIDSIDFHVIDSLPRMKYKHWETTPRSTRELIDVLHGVDIPIIYEADLLSDETGHLRLGVREEYRETKGVQVSPSRIDLTTLTPEGFMHILMYDIAKRNKLPQVPIEFTLERDGHTVDAVMVLGVSEKNTGDIAFSLIAPGEVTNGTATASGLKIDEHSSRLSLGDDEIVNAIIPALLESRDSRLFAGELDKVYSQNDTYSQSTISPIIKRIQQSMQDDPNALYSALEEVRSEALSVREEVIQRRNQIIDLMHDNSEVFSYQDTEMEPGAHYYMHGSTLIRELYTKSRSQQIRLIHLLTEDGRALSLVPMPSGKSTITEMLTTNDTSRFLPIIDTDIEKITARNQRDIYRSEYDNLSIELLQSMGEIVDIDEVVYTHPNIFVRFGANTPNETVDLRRRERSDLKFIRISNKGSDIGVSEEADNVVLTMFDAYDGVHIISTDEFDDRITQYGDFVFGLYPMSASERRSGSVLELSKQINEHMDSQGHRRDGHKIPDIETLRTVAETLRVHRDKKRQDSKKLQDFEEKVLSAILHGKSLMYDGKEIGLHISTRSYGRRTKESVVKVQGLVDEHGYRPIVEINFNKPSLVSGRKHEIVSREATHRIADDKLFEDRIASELINVVLAAKIV